MNYTYQSFNFRNRQGARPFYDLIASIAAEEFAQDAPNSHQFLAGGAAAMVQDSLGKALERRQRRGPTWQAREPPATGGPVL